MAINVPAGEESFSCEDAEPSNLLTLETGERRYAKLAAARLKSVRVLAGMDIEEEASRLTDVFGTVVTARMIETWESGAESFGAGVMLAALDVTGVTEAQLLGIDAPSMESIHRLDAAIARVRALLNDPAALTQRAHEVLTNTARGTHPKPLI